MKKQLSISVIVLLVVFCVGCGSAQTDITTEGNNVNSEELPNEAEVEEEAVYEKVITLPEGYNQLQKIYFLQNKKLEGSNIPNSAIVK